MYKNSPENLSKLFAASSFIGCNFRSIEELEVIIKASINIVNDTTGKYGERELKAAQSMVKLAMAGDLVSRLDGVGSASKTVLRTTPRL